MVYHHDAAHVASVRLNYCEPSSLDVTADCADMLTSSTTFMPGTRARYRVLMVDQILLTGWRTRCVPASALAGYEAQLRGTQIHVRFSYRAAHWTPNVTPVEAEEYDMRINLPLSAATQQR
jgi:hypothetical protein